MTGTSAKRITPAATNINASQARRKSAPERVHSTTNWDVGPQHQRAAVRVVATCTDVTNVPNQVRTTFQQHIDGGEIK